MKPSREELLAALMPFAKAALEVRSVGDISQEHQFVWKPQNGNRLTNGISVKHLNDALEIIHRENT